MGGCGTVANIKTVKIEGRWRLAPWQDELRLVDETTNLDEGVFKPSAVLRGEADEANEFLIMGNDEWHTIWKSVEKLSPEVDFGTLMILGVCRLITGDGLQDFYIDYIEEREGGFVVHIKTQILPPGTVGPAEVLGTTAEYVAIKRTSIPFVFAEEPFWVAEGNRK